MLINNYIKWYILWKKLEEPPNMPDLAFEAGHQGTFHFLLYRMVPTSLHKGTHFESKISSKSVHRGGITISLT